MKLLNILLIFCFLNVSSSYGQDRRAPKPKKISQETSAQLQGGTAKTCSSLINFTANAADIIVSNVIIFYAINNLIFQGLLSADMDSGGVRFAIVMTTVMSGIANLILTYDKFHLNRGDADFKRPRLITRPFYNLLNSSLQNKFESPEQLMSSGKFKNSAIIGNEELKTAIEWTEMVGEEVIVTEYQLYQKYLTVAGDTGLSNRSLVLPKPFGVRKIRGILQTVNEAEGTVVLKGLVGSPDEKLTTTVVMTKNPRTNEGVDTDGSSIRETADNFFAIKPLKILKEYTDPYFFSNFFYDSKIASIIDQKVEISYVNARGKKMSQRGTLKSLDNNIAVIISDDETVTGNYELLNNQYDLRLLNQDKKLLEKILVEIDNECKVCAITKEDLKAEVDKSVLEDDFLEKLVDGNRKIKEAMELDEVSRHVPNYLEMNK